uniref:Uncharacterized protein n=1 Tax=Trichogramma kaykai TaxID=54128 RepID=A0ABD2WGS4_9HYME
MAESPTWEQHKEREERRPLLYVFSTRVCEHDEGYSAVYTLGDSYRLLPCCGCCIGVCMDAPLESAPTHTHTQPQREEAVRGGGEGCTHLHTQRTTNASIATTSLRQVYSDARSRIIYGEIIAERALRSSSSRSTRGGDARTHTDGRI